MAAIKMAKGLPEYEFHNDFMHLHKEFGEVENNDAYWNALSSKMCELSRKYAGTPYEKLANAWAVSFAEFLDKEARERFK